VGAKVEGDPDQETVPVYPVPAVVVVTGVAPVTGAVTPAIAATEIVVARVAEGATEIGSGDGGGAAVVIEVEIGEVWDDPAAFLAVNVNV
jgi:hypothetical protein